MQAHFPAVEPVTQRVSQCYPLIVVWALTTAPPQPTTSLHLPHVRDRRTEKLRQFQESGFQVAIGGGHRRDAEFAYTVLDSALRGRHRLVM